MNNKVNLRFTKAKFRFKIFDVVKEDSKDGRIKIIGSKTEWCRGSDFERSLREDYKNKVERKIEFCDGEPSSFSIGVIYVRKDGQMVYTYREVDAN